MTLKELYSFFVEKHFCENQDIIVRVIVYRTYNDYDDNIRAYLDRFHLSSLYSNEAMREHKFKQYENEFEYTDIKTSDVDSHETMFITCHYIKEC